MIEQRVDDVPAAVHEVQDARRQTDRVDQLEDFLHRQRHALGGFKHDGVAAGDRVRQEPEWNHAGKIEGRDDRTDPQRLANHDLVNPSGDVLGVVALNQDGCAACDVDVLDGAAHLAPRFGERFAALERDRPGDVVEVLFEKGFELEQELHAVGDGRAAPRGKGPACRVNRLSDVCDCREWRRADLFARRGIENRERVCGCRRHPLTPDVIAHLRATACRD